MPRSDHILKENNPVTLVGGGEATPDDLHKALTLGSTCVAADGGAGLARAAGVEIAALIGDFDSVTAETLALVPLSRQHPIAEQDSTDFEKALTRISTPLIIGVGFLGGRVDHQLGAFHVLQRYPERPCVLLGAREVICLTPPNLRLDTAPGDTVSLFPLAPVTGRSEGLAWPIEGLSFAPGRQSGTSNRATGPMVLDMDGPDMLLILPRAQLAGVVAALAAPDAARWPARAG